VPWCSLLLATSWRAGFADAGRPRASSVASRAVSMAGAMVRDGLCATNGAGAGTAMLATVGRAALLNDAGAAFPAAGGAVSVTAGAVTRRSRSFVPDNSAAFSAICGRADGPGEVRAAGAGCGEAVRLRSFAMPSSRLLAATPWAGRAGGADTVASATRGAVIG